ncbi:MAG: substrate-binding domain-containing protein [Acidobacteria bacterium]|nr:substrate-binding domain-containing protein [Acidobacteriota bacterium]
MVLMGNGSARRRVAAVTVAAALLLSSACRQTPRKRQIGVVPKAVNLVFWQSIHGGSVAAARELGVGVVWNGPQKETDVARQIEIVDSMISARLDGIVVAPTDATSLVAVVERAGRAGIPVVVFDSGINTDRIVSYVATDNYRGGVVGARKLGELLNGKGAVAVVRMVPGSNSTGLREQGFQETLGKEFPGIRIVAEQYCMADHARALAVAENMLAAHPNLSGMFGSTEPATVGPAQAVKTRRLAGRVKIVGFDFGNSIEQDLKAGVIDAVVVQDPFQIGYTAVRTLVASLNGHTPDRRIDIPARLISGRDLAIPEVDRWLHPNLDKYLK